MNIRILAIMVTLAALISGCATTSPQYIGETETNSTHSSAQNITLGIDASDFNRAADEAVQSMLASGAVNKPEGGRYVLAISNVINDTMQRIDTDQLVKKIRVALLNSGKVVVTTAVSASGAEDAMTFKARELRNSDEFNQATVAKKGQIIAPDMSLSGKIIQRNSTLADGKQRVDYYFHLTLTELNSGLAYWEGETVIGKAGSNKSVSW